MIKYIYDNNKLRCRLKYIPLHGSTELQLQRRSFWGWFNCFKFITVAEDHWHGFSRFGDEAINPCTMEYEMGGHHEGWLPGTLNIKTRVLEFFKTYYQSVLAENKRVKEFKSIA